MAHLLETIRCIHCGAKQPIPPAAAPELRGGTACRIPCGDCQHWVYVRGEGRRHPRRKVALPGRLYHHEARDTLDRITVTSLSTGGIGFTTQQYRPVRGVLYDVVFALNDPQNSVIMDTIIIRRVASPVVGAEFYPAATSNHTLDVYMAPDSTAVFRA